MSLFLNARELAGTPDSFAEAFNVAAATKLTSTYAKDTTQTGAKGLTRWSAGWVDSKTADNVSTNIFDLIQFVVTPLIGSAKKIRIRIALSNESTKAAATSQYYREGGVIWEQDFGTADTAVRVALDPMSLKFRYFAIEAKYVDGSDTGTGVKVEYAFLHSNQSDGSTFMMKPVLNKRLEIIRAATALPASGAMTANIDIDTLLARYSSVYSVYLPRNAACKGRMEIEKIDILAGVNYGVPTCPVHRGSIVSAGTYVQTEIRPEQVLMKGPNTTVALTAGSWTTGTATITIVAHGLRVGDWFSVVSNNPAGYDTAMSQVVSVPSVDTITYLITADPGTWNSSGVYWKGVVNRAEFNDASRYDMIRIRAQEIGNTATPGILFLLGKTMEN